MKRRSQKMHINRDPNDSNSNNHDGKNLDEGSGKSISPQKLAANQRNAQRSTGPRSDAGKARSAQNSYKHGFFASKLFRAGQPASTENQETTKLGKQIWDYYAPVGYMEELLVEKITCESVRYGRLLGYEQEEFGRSHAFFGPAVDRVLRYQAAINRQLFQAIKQLDDLQAKRKAQSGGNESEDLGMGAVEPMETIAGDEVQPEGQDSCSED
jgi:hypothetical protein